MKHSTLTILLIGLMIGAVGCSGAATQPSSQPNTNQGGNNNPGTIGGGEEIVAQNEQTPDEEEDEVLWPKQLGTAQRDSGEQVAVDLQGNIIVAGITVGVLDTGVARLVGDQDLDIFLIKYDSAGRELWRHQLRQRGDDEVFALTVDTEGAIYVAGRSEQAWSGFTFGGGDYDAFVVKLSSQGAEEWIQMVNAPADDEIRALAIYQDFIYAAGRSTEDINLWRYARATGDHNPAADHYEHRGSTQYDEILGLAVDSQGRLYAGGYTQGSLPIIQDGFSQLIFNLNGNFWEQQLWTNIGGNDAFVMRFSDQLLLRDTFTIATSEDEYISAVAVDDSDNIFFAGDALATRLSPDPQTFVAKYDASLNRMWLTQADQQDRQVTMALAVDANGYAHVAGWRQLNADRPDITVHRIDVSDGEILNTRVIDSGSPGNQTIDLANDVAVDAQGNVYVTGSTNGLLPPLADEPEPHGGGNDLILIKILNDGELIW